MFLYSLKLISSVNKITLPEPLGNVKRIKINKIKYRTAIDNQHHMIITMTGFDNNRYFDGVNNIDYLFSLFIPSGSNQEINYLDNGNCNSYDNQYGTPINSFDFNVLIDGDYSPYINQDNPLYIEILFLS
jgi:hypothetical protein